MNVLSIDMDLFQDEICLRTYASNDRANNVDYKAWSSEVFIQYLENNLGLSKSKKTRGCLVYDHHHIFYYLRTHILDKTLSIPFNFIHLDAHFDTGYLMDGSWQYILSEYISKDIAERYYPEKLTDYYKYASFSCSNFVLYMAANKWLNEIKYVYHPKLKEFDFFQYFVECVNFDNKKFRMGLTSMDWRQFSGTKNIFELVPEVKIEVPIKCVNSTCFFSDIDYDFVCVALSPEYTSKDIDELYKIISEYIDVEYK